MNEATKRAAEDRTAAAAVHQHFDLTVSPAHAGERLDRFLASHAVLQERSLSRTRLKSLIADGKVRLAGSILLDPARVMRAGEVVQLLLPPPAPGSPSAQAMPLRVVFEDAHLIVIDKAAGLVVHPAPGHVEGTLVNALLAHCGTSLSGVGGVLRPGIVHRLDKNTSGLMVAAKTDAAHQGLAALFADHGRRGSLVRAYSAVVWGVPRSRGTIDAPLGRHPANREKMAVVAAEKGRRAVTHFSRVERFGAVASLLECRLQTGRTHQIRVHLAHAGHPLLGDPIYGAGFSSKAAQLGAGARAALLALGRQALHAGHLGFVHPLTGKELMFESALPVELQALTEALRGETSARIVDEG